MTGALLHHLSTSTLYISQYKYKYITSTCSEKNQWKMKFKVESILKGNNIAENY